MTLERDNYCFACGKDNPRGLKLDISFDAEKASCEYTVPDDLQGWPKITHGGVISTMLDEMMVWAAAGLQKHVVTAELTIRFKKPLPVGKKISLEARILEDKKRIMTAQAKIFDSKDVYAEASGKLIPA
ncbi:PaaI family thioesterase [bacterium]|nr:PaaI family thioesterase [bacterium]